MPKGGLEPPRISPLPPQDSVSTNSTTSALMCGNIKIPDVCCQQKNAWQSSFSEMLHDFRTKRFACLDKSRSTLYIEYQYRRAVIVPHIADVLVGNMGERGRSRYRRIRQTDLAFLMLVSTLVNNVINHIYNQLMTSDDN